MALYEFSQEKLLGKKYNELLKISKAFGIKTSKRLKTEKLIEAILKCQQEEAVLSLSQDAAAVVSALDGASHTCRDTEAGTTTLDGTTHSKHISQENELLLDIQFPDCGSKDFLECHSDSATDTSLQGDAVTGKEEAAAVAIAGHRQTHKRSGTYEIEEMEVGSGDSEGKKLQRSSTFDLSASNDATLPIDEKETAENSKQMSVLVDKITVRRTLRSALPPKLSLAQHTPNIQGMGDDSQPVNKEGLYVSCKRRHSQIEPVTKESLPSSSRHSRLFTTSSAKRRRQSVTVTPSAPAPPLRLSLLQRQSCGTPSMAAALTKTTTTATTSSTTKPLFTIGRGDKKEAVEGTQDGKPGIQGKGASAIPRFMSYARRLKVPNFARIHEQAFQRMDSLDEYVGKRRARHDTLGSTTKKQDKAEVFQPSITSVKNLNFNFAEESAAEFQDETKTSQAVNEDKTAPNHLQARDTVTRSMKKAVNTLGDARLSRRLTQDIKPANVFTSSAKRSVARKSSRLSCRPSLKSAHKISPREALKTPLNPEKKHQDQKQSYEVSPKTEDDTLPTTEQKLRTGDRAKASPRLRCGKKNPTVTFAAFGSHLKENCSPGPDEVASPASVRKRMQDYSKNLAASGRSYVPYKGPVKPIKQRDNLKNLAQRKHNVKSSKEIREGQKNILKGVRLNKRFELQMANRGIKL